MGRLQWPPPRRRAARRILVAALLFFVLITGVFPAAWNTVADESFSPPIAVGGARGGTGGLAARFPWRRRRDDAASRCPSPRRAREPSVSSPRQDPEGSKEQRPSSKRAPLYLGAVAVVWFVLGPFSGRDLRGDLGTTGAYTNANGDPRSLDPPLVRHLRGRPPLRGKARAGTRGPMPCGDSPPSGEVQLPCHRALGRGAVG